MTEAGSEPDFTVITPVYNGADWIEETIESVLRVCAGTSFEYIIVNDGSVDATKQILSKYDDIVHVVHQKNKGEAAAVNVGLKLGRGSYALIVSADDPMRSSELLTKSKEILESDKNIICTYPDWSVIDSKSNVIRNVIVEEYSERRLLGEFKCIVGPGGIFRREAAITIGGRDPRYKFTSDYEFWLRLSRLGKFHRIPGFLAFWREHESSTSIAHRGLEMAIERICVVENFISENREIPKHIQRMARGHSHMQGALLIYFDKRIPAKKWLYRAITIYPRGIFKFNCKSMLYIILFPVSPKILQFLKRIGIYRNLPNSV